MKEHILISQLRLNPGRMRETEFWWPVSQWVTQTGFLLCFFTVAVKSLTNCENSVLFRCAVGTFSRSLCGQSMRWKWKRWSFRPRLPCLSSSEQQMCKVDQQGLDAISEFLRARLFLCLLQITICDTWKLSKRAIAEFGGIQEQCSSITFHKSYPLQASANRTLEHIRTQGAFWFANGMRRTNAVIEKRHDTDGGKCQHRNWIQNKLIVQAKTWQDLREPQLHLKTRSRETDFQLVSLFGDGPSRRNRRSLRINFFLAVRRSFRHCSCSHKVWHQRTSLWSSFTLRSCCSKEFFTILKMQFLQSGWSYKVILQVGTWSCAETLKLPLSPLDYTSNPSKFRSQIHHLKQTEQLPRENEVKESIKVMSLRGSRQAWTSCAGKSRTCDVEGLVSFCRRKDLLEIVACTVMTHSVRCFVQRDPEKQLQTTWNSGSRLTVLSNQPPKLGD